MLSDQALTKNQYFVLRYIIENNKTNSIDMVVSLNITTSTDPVNFNVSYAYTTESTDLSTKLSSNRSKFSSSFTPQELKAGSTAYIYVLCEIANLDIDASFVGTANWELTDKNEFEGEYEQEILWNYAEIKSGDYVRSAIWGSTTIKDTTSYGNETVQSVTFGSYADYANEVSGITNTTEKDEMYEPGYNHYDGGINIIDISANSDASVKVYRVADGSYFDVYILATETNTKIKFNADSSNVFANMVNLSTVEFNDLVDTSSVTDMSGMFQSSIEYNKISILDLSSWDTSSVTDMSYMFHYCRGLSTLDVSSFDTSSVTNMSNMFYCCSGLSTIDVSNFNTSSVTDMSKMFSECSGLSTLDLSNFDTSSVTDMSNMFYNCRGLSELDISNFDTSSVTNMSKMFSECSGLSELDVSNFDTSSVTSMNSMFDKCSGLSELDVSNFDTSSVTSMNSMFYKCSGLSTLDVSNFNTSSVTDMSYMFRHCSGLTAIYIGSGWSTSKVVYGGSMFADCTSLPNYNSSYVRYTDCSRYMTLKDGAGE